MPDINPKQIQLIKMAQKQLGMCKKCYQRLLREEFDTTSCTHLSYHQASRLIDIFVGLGWKAKEKKHPRQLHPIKYPHEDGGKIVKLMTEPQRGLIEYLAGQIEWKYADGLRRFCQRMMKKDYPCTRREAWLLIEALKKMAGRKMGTELETEEGQRAWSEESARMESAEDIF